MFCSQNCHDIGHGKFHAMECGRAGADAALEIEVLVIFRTVIKALDLFKTVQNLMDIIEKFNNEEPNSMLNSDNLSLRAYLQFFGLGQGSSQNIEHAKIAYAMIKSHFAYEAMFESREANRFLEHLTLHHIRVIEENLMGNHIPLLGFTYPETGSIEWGTFGGIYLNSCVFNHSCQPNIGRALIGSKLVGKAIRSVKRGEQLFTSYL